MQCVVMLSVVMLNVVGSFLCYKILHICILVSYRVCQALLSLPENFGLGSEPTMLALLAPCRSGWYLRAEPFMWPRWVDLPC